MSQATVAWLFGVPSAFTKTRSGRWPITFGAMRSRYSISILATCGGMSKANSMLVLHLACRHLQARHGAGPLPHEQVDAEGERREVFWSQRHIGQDRYAEGGLRLGECSEVRFCLPLHLRPEAAGQVDQALQDRGIVELAQRGLVLGGEPRLPASASCR